MHYQQLSLFSLAQYQSIPHVYDPAWDKLDDGGCRREPTDVVKVADQQVAFVEPQPSSEKFAPEQSLPAQVVDVPVATEQTSTEVQVESNTSNPQNPNNCVRAQVTSNALEVAPEPNYLDKKITQWVETYWVKRDSEKHFYYRYCWMSGRKKHRIHISGGNVYSPLTQERKQAVEEAIALDMSPDQIKQLIHSFNPR